MSSFFTSPSSTAPPSSSVSLRKAKAAERVRLLCEAARQNDCDALSAMLLLAKADVDARSSAPEHCLGTPTFAAADCGALRATQLLVQAKADVNKTAGDKDGLTPMHAAASGGHCDVLLALIRGKAHVGPLTKASGVPPALMAAYGGQLSALQVLADAKADLDVRSSSDGMAPVHVAALRGDPETVRLLARAKADLDAFSRYDGGLATCLATMRGNTAALQALIDCRVNVHKAWRSSCSPLFMAIHNRRREALQVLLLAKADPNQQARAVNGDPREDTPVHAATDLDDGEAVRLLAMHKGDVNYAKSEDGCTPAHVAVAKARLGALQQLLLAKADIMTRRTTRGTIWHAATISAGKTVRDFARRVDRRDILDLLAQHAAVQAKP